MKIELLMATMKRNSISDINLEERNIDNIDLLIINQTTNNNISSEKCTKMINFNEIGIAKSRNRAIENTDADIAMISDDDVIYEKNLIKIIERSFIENPDADIITFKIVTPEGEEFNSYKDKSFYHNERSILKVSSIEVAFRTKTIKEKNIKFDEFFGLGAKYISGEENIFLMDCLKNGLVIKFIPIVIGKHPKESSGHILDESAIYSKGALFYRLFGYKCLYLNLLFIIKKLKIIKFNKFKAISLIYKGTKEYIITETTKNM